MPCNPVLKFSIRKLISDGKPNIGKGGTNRTHDSSLQSDNEDEEIDVIDDDKNFSQVRNTNRRPQWGRGAVGIGVPPVLSCVLLF